VGRLKAVAATTTRLALRSLRAFDRLEIGPVRVEPRRLICPYTVTGAPADERRAEPARRDRASIRPETFHLIYRYEEPVFRPGDAASRGLASMIAAQVALNYGLFCGTLRFRGPYDRHDRRFLARMAENTAREIFVNKLLRPNRFLTGPTRGLQGARLRAPRKFCSARLQFAGPADEFAGKRKDAAVAAIPPAWPANGRGGWAVLSSGGKDSLASYGLLRELGLRPQPVFVNESGRHWFTALNAYRGLRAADPATARVWTNADRLFSWMTRRLPFVRPDFARLRSDDYPVRLWTMAVFLFGALPVLRARGLTLLAVGNEHDTTRRVRFRGIRHYDGLYDQSLGFDRAVSRYLRAKGWKVRCLSLLRPLSELGIEKLLAERYPRLLAWQVSCHAARLAGGRALPCGACEKCRRIVALLSAAGKAPSRCGYRREQVRACLRVLARRREQGLSLEPADARALLAVLEARRLLPAGGTNGAWRDAERHLLRVRLDSRRSPPEELPPEVRGRLLAIYRRILGAVRVRSDPQREEQAMKKNLRPLRAAFVLLVLAAAQAPAQGALRPTPSDALGPFYKPGAPVRSSVGQGYALSGRVLSSRDGRALPGAVVELWLAGPDGEYSDDYRATLIADAEARYRFTSHLPVAYAGRPPHIHLRVSAAGHETLVTQHYPPRGRREAVFDLVLRAE
jgi:hypothetical protein